jgi:hypothetical protein
MRWVTGNGGGEGKRVMLMMTRPEGRDRRRPSKNTTLLRLCFGEGGCLFISPRHARDGLQQGIACVGAQVRGQRAVFL